MTKTDFTLALINDDYDAIIEYYDKNREFLIGILAYLETTTDNTYLINKIKEYLNG